MTKTVLFSSEAREKLYAGVKKITDAVRVTMGASGKCVLIGETIIGQDSMMHQLPTIVTKDGFTVTKHFTLADPFENRGAMLIREAAFKTVYEAGDATTLTCVLANAIIAKGIELIDNGANSQELKKGIDFMVEKVVERLKEISLPVRGDQKKIFHVATVSANNDESIGRMISDAFEKIGPEGIIDLEPSKGLQTEIKLADGYKFQKSWVSSLFINQRDKMTCEFEGCYILLYDKKILHYTQIQRVLELIAAAQKPLLIICDGAAEDGLGIIITNVQNRKIRACVVFAPGFGDERAQEMEDLEIVTGADYISDLRDKDIKEVEIEQFGYARKVVVNKDETVIIGGDKNKVALETMLNELKMNLTQCKNEDERAPIERRIARLTSGVAVIQVAAATETEMKERMDRFDDSVRSTKSALSEGIVAGGGTALLNIADDMEMNGLSGDSLKGAELVRESLIEPVIQMAENAGKDPTTVLSQIRSHNMNGWGYNTLADSVNDMVQVGVIDSTKAIRCALVNAASVAGMFLISECLMETSF